MTTTPLPLPEFAAELLALYRCSRAPKTAQRVAQVLGLLASLPGVATTADLTPATAAAFAALAARGRHPNTAATLISYLRRACSYAVDRGCLDRSPFAAWPGLVRFVPSRGPGVHPPGAIARVLAALEAAATTFAGGRLWAWSATLAHTGLRRDEALYLRDEDFAACGSRFEVSRRLKRPSARRVVPVPGALAEVLARWRAGRPAGWLFPNARGSAPWRGGAPGYRPTDRLRAAGEAAGVPGFTPGSLRHSFATLCATTWSVPPAILQRLMGHTDLRTTLKYYVHLDAEALSLAARRIDFGPAA